MEMDFRTIFKENEATSYAKEIKQIRQLYFYRGNASSTQ
jgi:hypothetical protein